MATNPESRRSDPREAGQEGRTRIQADTERVASELRDSGRHGAQELRDTVERGADTLQNTVEKGADTAERGAREGAGVAAYVTQKTGDTVRQATESGRKLAGMGLNAFSGLQTPLADVSYEEGRRLLDHTTKASDLYRGVAERTAEDVQALVMSSITLGRGLQNWQHAYLRLLNQGLQKMQRKPQDLLRARNVTEFAEIQRDLYQDFVGFAVEAGTTLLDLSARIAQEAVQPLEDRGRSASRA